MAEGGKTPAIASLFPGPDGSRVKNGFCFTKQSNATFPVKDRRKQNLTCVLHHRDDTLNKSAFPLPD